MTEVYLHVYDITRETDRSNAKAVLTSLNGAGRWTGLGGIFHGGIEVFDVEWSYGYMESPGTGVYSCRPKDNPMYTFRETRSLGKTRLSPTEVKVVIRRLQGQWQGSDYTLVKRNCNHFCEELARQLGVEVPGWLNRLALGADVVSTLTNQATENARWLSAGLSAIIHAQALDTRQRQDLVREARNMQMDATKLLALLLEAPNAQRAAEEHVGSLTEQFFAIASTYLTMAKKEGDAEVVTRLEAVLKAAMDEKQKMLRPEIQLLNRLLAVETSAERKQVLNSAAAGDALQMNEGYFFRLLEHMTVDVKRQPENAGKAPLVARLEACKIEALERLPPTQKAAP
ncbi:hypothetical protein WJX81_002995 [Elliptochloris bilobata]|uniref:PPPDE domain-containing protein n=1 Tax=Elliptochloris bilobata TaxID=381761 RepID=A0AAW1S8V5_9CHLO